jgi:hypothetical protein
VNLGVVQTLDQLKQLVYRPAAVKVMRILDCHAVVGFGGGERVNDWSKPSRGSRGFKEREEDSRWMYHVSQSWGRDWQGCFRRN